MTSFRTGILIAFGVFAVIGALIFAGVGGFTEGGSSVRPVTIWGTVDDGIMKELLVQLRNDLKKFTTPGVILARSTLRISRLHNTQLLFILSAP